MHLYKVKIDMEPKKDRDIFVYTDKGKNIPQYELNAGKFYTGDQNISFVFDANEGDIATDFLDNINGWFLVSKRLVNIIENVNTTTQIISVKINEKENRVAPMDYYIVNILTVVNALCLAESDYFDTYVEGYGTYHTILKYAIHFSKINNADLFKLGDNQETEIFCTETFKSLVESEQLSGIAFEIVKTV